MGLKIRADEWCGTYLLEYVSNRMTDRTVKAKTGQELFDHAKRGLMSRDVCMEWDEENRQALIYAGMRLVCRAKLQED